MTIARFVNTRPFSIFGIINAIHTLVYGLGYMLGSGGFPGTVLYHNISDLMPHFVFGVILTLMGTLGLAAWIIHRRPWIKWSCALMGFTWFFAFLVYTLNGAFLLGVGIGLTSAALSWYLSYAWDNRSYMAEHNIGA